MGCPPKPHAPVLALRIKKVADEYIRFNGSSRDVGF